MNHHFLPRMTLISIIYLMGFLLFHSPCEAKEDTAQLVFRKSAASSAETYAYIIKKGDSLLDIVKNELGITKNRIPLIKRYNPDLKNLNLIHPGQKLILPTKSRKITSPSPISGVVAPPEPDMKAGVLQPSAGLPSASRLAVMHTILRRMNGTMVTTGRHVIPIPEIGQITIDCEMIPVIEFDDGSVIFMDFKRQMPENIKILIRKYWPNYTVVAANAQDDTLKVLADAVNASKAYTMKKQAGPFLFGQKPAVRFPADWLISGKPSTSRASYLQVLVTITTETRRLPAPLIAYLGKKQLVVTEILNQTIIASWPAQAADNTVSPLPRLNSGTTKSLIIDLLGHLDIQPVTDTDVKIFDSVTDGFNLSVEADIEARNVARRVIYTAKQLPKQFIDILKGKATEIILLPEGESPKTAIEKTLTAFLIPHSTVPYMFPVSANADLMAVKVIFPTIRFLAKNAKPIYLIDFNMDPSLYELLHDQMEFNIISY